MSKLRKAKVVFLYEHAARELDVVCAVSSLLRTHGVQVEIVQWPAGFFRVVGLIHPRLVVLPYCYYRDKSLTPLLQHWYNAIFFNVAWEQLFYPGNLKGKTPHGQFAIQHVIHHAWSETYAAFLRTHGIQDDHIYINGQPAYTLYDEPYRFYFTSRASLASKYNLDTTKKWIFFPENYNWAFYSKATLARFIADGQSPEDVQMMKEYCNRSLADVLRWCQEAAKQGQVELILRPRPATSIEDFRVVARNVLGDIPTRLHIIQSESVREWILAADLVISSYSTSLIEAAVAGKPHYMLDPYPIPAPLHVAWHDLVRHVKNKEEFISVCLQPEDEMSDNRLGSWARQTLMSRGDAIENLSIFINRLLDGEVPRPPVLSSRQFRTIAMMCIPEYIWGNYRRLRYRRRPIPAVYVKDVVSPAEIESRIQKWQSLLAGV